MDKEFFIDAIKGVRDESCQATLEVLNKPPGRKPHKSDLENSQFYHSLNDEQRYYLKRIVYEAIDMGVFSILCILDHVHFIEDTEEKTTFELYAVKDNKRVLLNDFDDEPLHDIFNSLVMQDDD